MQLEIKTTIDAFNPNQVKALNDFLTAIGGRNTESVAIPQYPAIEEKPKLTRKKSEKVESPIIETQEDAIEDKQEEAIGDTQEETKLEAIEVIEPESVGVPTLMQIRSLVAQKAAEHKEAIKAKLVELGAQNVSTLDAKHFQTIFDFLTEL